MSSFAPNPLSLSVPEPAFESWLRDSGYLELLDHRTTQLHTLHSSSSSSAHPTTNTTTPTPSSTPHPTATTTILSITYSSTMSLVSSLTTLFSLLALNPFARLTSADFGPHNSATWTDGGFLGCFESYSFPSSPTQARMRVHENVKRFARNYSALLLLFFACSLYQMPLALFGLLSCLALWELFRFCDRRWALDQHPAVRQVLIRAGQCAVMAIIFFTNVQLAVFSTLAVAYAVLILHASFRKLTPAKQPPKGRGR